MAECDLKDKEYLSEIFEQGKKDREEGFAEARFQSAVDDFNDLLDDWISHTETPAENAMFQYIRDLPDSTEREFEYKLYVFNDGKPLSPDMWGEFKTREETEQIKDKMGCIKVLVNTVIVAVWGILGFVVAPCGLGHFLLLVPAIIVLAIANAIMCEIASEMYSHTYLGYEHPLAVEEEQKGTGCMLGAVIGVAGAVYGAAKFPKDVADRMTRK